MLLDVGISVHGSPVLWRVCKHEDSHTGPQVQLKWVLLEGGISGPLCFLFPSGPQYLRLHLNHPGLPGQLEPFPGTKGK